MFNDEQIKNISKNIKILGMVYKENQRDIAEAIGVGESTISNYINGLKPPKRENLSKIAKHFNISENELINTDLSVLLELNNGEGFYSFLSLFLKNMHIIFPIIKTDDNIDDIDFNNAVKLNKKLWENFEKEKEPNLSEIIELYFLSYEKCKNLDALANIAILLLILKIDKKENLKEYLEIYNPFDKVELEFIVKDCILTRFDDIILAQDNSTLIKSTEDSLINFIDIIIDNLSDFEKYKDFIYYFITLRYIFGVGVITKEKPVDICKIIGMEMLENLVVAKNSYALQFSEKLFNLFNFK